MKQFYMTRDNVLTTEKGKAYKNYSRVELYKALKAAANNGTIAIGEVFKIGTIKMIVIQSNDGRIYPGRVEQPGIENVTPLIFSYLDGKMDGMTALSSNPLENFRCIERFEYAILHPEENIVCAHCFSIDSLLNDGRKTPQKLNLSLNSYILNSEVLPDDILPLIDPEIFPKVRIESSGDVASGIAAINYLRIVLLNPGVYFGVWTKNLDFWKTAFDYWNITAENKPSNMTFIYSNMYVDRPNGGIFDRELYWFVDAVFNVFSADYAELNGININCCDGITKRRCKNCENCCYNGGCGSQLIMINEMLKADAAKREKAALKAKRTA